MFTNIISTSRSFLKHIRRKSEVPVDEVKPHLQPWQRVDWPPEKEQSLYMQWGAHCARRQQIDLAENYYTKALGIRDNNAKTLYRRSNCSRSLAKTEAAFKDSLKATYYAARNPEIDLEYCQTLYELNEFEKTKAECYDISRKYVGTQKEVYLHFGETVDSNLKDSCGKSLGPFFAKNRRIFDDVLKKYRSMNHYDPRPLWKILKEQEKCDVLSVLEKEDELLHPLEIARRELDYKIFSQTYLQNSWKDVFFMRNLRKHPDWLITPFRESTPYLQKLLGIKYDAVKKFEKMLHARSPLYHEKNFHIKHKKLCDISRESHLYRVEYQTRRDFFTILRTIGKLRKTGEIEKLSKYVEKTMGDYVIRKTSRVAPFKFEFMNDVYNTLALAHADKYYVPSGGIDITASNAILKFLGLPQGKDTISPSNFVFGDRSTHIDPSAPDEKYEAYKRFLARMEKRLKFAKFPIERAYILHEIGRAHFNNHHFYDCHFVAHAGLEGLYGQYLRSVRFLCTMLIVKSHAAHYKTEKCNEALRYAYKIAQRINSSKLMDFVEVAKSINDFRISRLATIGSVERKRKSRQSQYSEDERMSIRSVAEVSSEEYPK